jgi:hypothetical protein
MACVQLRERHQLRPIRKRRLQTQREPLQSAKLIRVQTNKRAGRIFKHPAQLRLQCFGCPYPSICSTILSATALAGTL